MPSRHEGHFLQCTKAAAASFRTAFSGARVARSRDGATPSTLKVYVNPNGLPSGSYSGTIVINAPGAATVSQNFPVTLDVGDAAGTLSASPGTLTFNFVTGGANPASQPIVLMTTGGALTAAIAVTGGTWLKASPAAASLSSDARCGQCLGRSHWSGAAGVYTGKIAFAASTSVNKKQHRQRHPQRHCGRAAPGPSTESGPKGRRSTRRPPSSP